MALTEKQQEALQKLMEKSQSLKNSIKEFQRNAQKNGVVGQMQANLAHMTEQMAYAKSVFGNSGELGLPNWGSWHGDQIGTTKLGEILGRIQDTSLTEANDQRIEREVDQNISAENTKASSVNDGLNIVVADLDNFIIDLDDTIQQNTYNPPNPFDTTLTRK